MQYGTIQKYDEDTGTDFSERADTSHELFEKVLLPWTGTRAIWKFNAFKVFHMTPLFYKLTLRSTFHLYLI